MKILILISLAIQIIFNQSCSPAEKANEPVALQNKPELQGADLDCKKTIEDFLNLNGKSISEIIRTLVVQNNLNSKKEIELFEKCLAQKINLVCDSDVNCKITKK